MGGSRDHGRVAGDTPLPARVFALPVIGDVLVPLAARVLVARRPRVTGWLERFDADRRAVARLAVLRGRYGEDPCLIRLPERRVAIVLATRDVRRVLEIVAS